MIFKSANANIYRVGDLLQYFKLDCKCETRHSIKLLAGLPFVLAFLSMKYKQSLGTTKLSSEFDTTVNLTHLLRKINNLAKGRISSSVDCRANCIGDQSMQDAVTTFFSRFTR